MSEAKPATTLYVSPIGNDAWSGLLHEPNADGSDGPFATICAARDALRNVDGAPNQLHTVFIRGGTYVVHDTIIFSIEDSAAHRNEHIYAAYPGEKPVFTSEVAIDGWQKLTKYPEGVTTAAHDNLWCAPLPDNLGRIRSLYDETGILTCARSKIFESDPEMLFKTHDHNPTRTDPYADLSDEERGRMTLYFPKGMLREWNNIEDIEIYSRSRNWTVNLLPLLMVDEPGQVAYTRISATTPISTVRKEVAVENTIEYLDAPGEWVVNTRERKIYLWPRDGAPAPGGIKAPRIAELFRIEGAVDKPGPVDMPVKRLTFRGLTFTCGERDVWNKDDESIQHDWAMEDKGDALVRFRGAERCTVEDCTFTQSAGTALRFDLHAQECRVLGCSVSHMGQSGVLFAGYGPGTKDVNRYNSVFNTEISYCGEIYPHGHGLILHQSGNNRIAHNYIHDMPRKAICLTGVRLWCYDIARRYVREHSRSIRWHEIDAIPTSWDECIPYSHTRENLVEYNEVSRCLGKLGDGSAINVSGAGCGNTLRRNYVHDIHPSEQVHAGCFRTDDNQKGTRIIENVITNSYTTAYQHKCDNIFSNNIIYNVENGRYIECMSYDVLFGNTEFYNNIFIDPNGDAVFYNREFGLWDLPAARIDKNIYFRMKQKKQNEKIDYDVDECLDVFRRSGHDVQSIFVDPLLVDINNNDFRLSPGSPAHKLGTLSLDVRGMGLIHKRRRSVE
jgi:hypothetical protein